MIKKSSKPILILSLAAVLCFGVVSCSNNSEAPKPTASPSVTSIPAGSPSAGTTPSALPTESSSTASKELSEAQKALPNLKVNAGENKEDILLAVYGASRYVNTIYNSGYLANGSWAKNGADSQELYKVYGKDWSDSYRAKMESIISDYHSTDSETQKEAAKLLMYNMFYSDDSMGNNIKTPDDCSQNNVGATSCLVGGNVILDKEITYQVNHNNGNIIVGIAFTDNLRLINNGVEGITPIHYNMQLEMMKNPYPDEQNLRFAYIVNDIGGQWTIDSWHKGE